MSDGRDKLGNFSLLKSLVGNSKLNDNVNKIKQKFYSSNNTENIGTKNNQVKKKHALHQKTMLTEIQGEKVRIPQYGQTISTQFINELINPSPAEEELIIKIDTNKEQEKEESRLFKWLCIRFSNCFNPVNKKPLKVGISDDIEILYQREFLKPIDRHILRNVLRRYVGDTRYQQAVFNHKQRYDLQGKVSEILADNHIEYAERRLQEIAEKAQLRAQGINIKEYYENKRHENANAVKQDDDVSTQNNSVEDDSHH